MQKPFEVRNSPVNDTIERTGNLNCEFLGLPAGLCGKIPSFVFSTVFKEGGLMKRMVLFASLGFGLICLSGCSILHKKHLRHATVIDGDSCGCGAAVPASFDGIPSSTVISPAPVPFSGPPPAPFKGAFPSYQG